METQVADFIAHYIGVPNVGDTAGNKGQCVGLIEMWTDQHKLPHIWGNAVDLMRYADPKVYTIVENSPDNFPPIGSIVCWDASWGGGDGHTAVVVAASVNTLIVFEQNNPENAPPLLGVHGYGGVQNWIVLP